MCNTQNIIEFVGRAIAMKHEEWKKISSAVNDDKDLNKGNVIDKIKEELKKYPEEYKKWEKVGFDVEYLFEIKYDRSTLLHLVNDTLIVYDRFTLLHLAAKNGHADVVNALINAGSKVNAKDTFKSTSLHNAASNGHIGIVNALIQNGANVNAKDTFKSTPLHNAASNGHIGIVNALIQNGADVNAKGIGGCTPLHDVVQYGHIGTVNALIQNGADLLLKNNSGKTPRDLAQYGDIKELLEKAEEEQLKKLNEEKNDLTQDKDDNKETTPLLEETEKKQPTSAIKKGVFAGGAVALLGTAAAVALFATGTVAVELIPIVIAVAAIAAALAVGGITYMMLKPSTEMDEVEEEQGITGDERKV